MVEEVPENMIMRNAANKYADMDLAVFPLFEKSKVPCIVNGFKVATKDHEQIDAWWSYRPYCNVGIACGDMSHGLVVIDLDVDAETGKDGIETLRAWEKEHGELPETASVVTGSGGLHMLYYSRDTVNSSTNKDAGVYIRANGGYIVAPPSIHPDTERCYEFEDYLEDVPIAYANENVLAFISSIQKNREYGEKFEVPEVIGKGERNDTLFRYACSLQEGGYTDGHIRAGTHALNQKKCTPPLPDYEVDRIVDSALRYEKGTPADKQATNDVDAKVPSVKSHNGMARVLIKDHHACFVDGAPAIWDGVRYAPGWPEVDRAMIRLDDAIKASKRREVREYIYSMAPHVQSSPPTLIAFSNGVYDIEKAELMQYSPDMVITNVIPHDFDMNSYDKETDDFLDRIACHEEATRQNLEEVIGLCMYRSNDFDVCPVLIGGGSNGKSTFIAALRNVIGNDNISSLDLNVIGKQFQAGRLLGKLANLGDDISNEFLKGDIIAVFKKIVSGEVIYTDVKGAAGFEFKPYCTLVFSCNDFPALGDSSEGTMRRLFPIPFNAQFSREDASYDPKIADKLCSDVAARYLVNLGVYGLHRVIMKNGMTPNDLSVQLIRDVRVENDNVLQWMDDEGMTADDLVGRAIPECFNQYTDWCKENNVRNIAKRTTFTRRILTRFKLKSLPRWHDFSNGKKQIKTFVRHEENE